MKRSALALGALATSVLVLSACASGPGGITPTSTPGSPLADVTVTAPASEVIGQGMVMDHAGTVAFCLGPVMESYPPQCHGIPLEGWSWAGREGSDTQGDVTWGDYALTGTYDGSVFTVTRDPIPLALYDPLPNEDPSGGAAGTTSDAKLEEIQDELHTQLGSMVLSSGPREGYLWVDVVWDDGALQSAVNEIYGDKVVFIRSALAEVTAR